MSPAIIAHVRALGFRVFMRNPSDSWLYYTDPEGKRIGYLGAITFGGYQIMSVHIPNRTTGTGALMRECSDVTEDDLRAGFAAGPIWFTSEDVAASKKYRDWDDFTSRDSWNASYKEVLL